LCHLHAEAEGTKAKAAIMKTRYEYIRFVEAGKTFDVITNGNDIFLGKIVWWFEWEEFVFFPYVITPLSKTGYLADIIDFIDQCTKEQKWNRKKSLSKTNS
jgi:hypothetical protein